MLCYSILDVGVGGGGGGVFSSTLLFRLVGFLLCFDLSSDKFNLKIIIAAIGVVGGGAAAAVACALNRIQLIFV